MPRRSRFRACDMRSLTFYLLIHTLAWGAVGAVIARWATVPRWLGAAVSIVVPVLGAAGLAGMRLLADQPLPLRATPAWRRLGWAAIGGGVLVGLAAWLPWAAGEVEGSAEELEVVEAGFDLASVAQLPILGTLLGLALVACGVVVVRSGIAAAVGTAAMVAWIPAAIAGGLILSESVVDDLGDKADRVANAASFMGAAHAQVSTEYSIGSGPYLCLLGSLVVLLWAFVWALRAGMQPLGAGSDGARVPTAWEPSRSAAAPIESTDQAEWEW